MSPTPLSLRVPANLTLPHPKSRLLFATTRMEVRIPQTIVNGRIDPATCLISIRNHLKLFGALFAIQASRLL